MENLDNALQMTPSNDDDDDVDMSNLVEVQKALEKKRAEIEMSEKAKLITDPVEEPNPWDVKMLEEFLFYNCPECPDKFSQRNEFISHGLEKHLRSTEILTAFKEKLIDEVTYETMELNEDFEDEGDTNELSVSGYLPGSYPRANLKNGSSCKFCGKVLSNRDKLKRHFKQVHKEKIRKQLLKGEIPSLLSLKFPLDVSSASVQTPLMVKKHPQPVPPPPMISTDGSMQGDNPGNGVAPAPKKESARELKNRTCPICQKALANRDKMRRHVKIVHKAKESKNLTQSTDNPISNDDVDMSNKDENQETPEKEQDEKEVSEKPKEATEPVLEDGKLPWNLRLENRTCPKCSKELKNREKMKRHLKQVHKIKPCDFFESFSRFPIKEKTEEEEGANTLENQENLSNENVEFDPSTAANDDEVLDENQEDLSKNEQCQETVVLDQA